MQQAAIKRRKASLTKQRGKNWKLTAKGKKSLLAATKGSQ
jgi:hypothetical protein